MSEQASPATALSGAAFPLNSFRDAAIHLRRPFTAEAVRWKVQATWNGGALIVPYVDARLVIERLNLVVPHLWHDEYEPVAGGKGLLCRLTVDGITRLDVGGGYEGKGLFSDAFKRAAVKFGIAVSLYALPKIKLNLSDGHLHDTGKKDKKGKPLYELTEKGEKGLRGGYATWLKETGEPKFGPALDHGDVEGAVGDVDAEQPASDQPELPPQAEPLTDAKAKALIEGAEKLYADLPKEAKKDLPKAAFKRRLAGDSTSHDDLEKLIADLEKRAG